MENLMVLCQHFTGHTEENNTKDSRSPSWDLSQALFKYKA